MFNPKENRQDYGSILSAPPNYELDFAIGTTYSLDLDSLVGASISLGLSEETDTVLRNNPIFLLEALRATGDKIALFCQKGNIHLPSNPTKLYILLEEMVFQVNTPKKYDIANYPSFHPKFWLIRFTNENGEVRYRIIVLSRNLTFDRSWDIVFSMEGKKKNEKTAKNKNLSLFLDYLKEFTTDSSKKDKINQIMEELEYIEFDLEKGPFEDFDFIPIGVGEEVSIKDYPLFNKPLDNLIVMSPFLSKEVIRDFNERITWNKNMDRVYMFTRAESLSKLSPEDCDQFKIYVLKDEIVDGESIISGEDITEFLSEVDNFEDIAEYGRVQEIAEYDMLQDESENIPINQESPDANQKQDIHAKIYLIRCGETVEIYLGSLNSSHNALNGNVEFMMRLKTNYRKYNMNKFLNDLFCGEEGGPESPFQLVDMNKINESPETEKGDDLDSIIKEIVRLNLKSEISFDGEFYKIDLTADDFDNFENKLLENNSKFNISFKPLLSEKEEEFKEKIIFEKLNLIQLSEFFVITVENDEESISRVVKIETDGIPDDREKDLISSIVNDKTAFIRYVAFLLGDNDILSALETGILNNGNGFDLQPQEVQLPALYEKMLYSACYDKDKFKEIEFLIQTLSDDDVIPEGFEDLYNTFKEVI